MKKLLLIVVLAALGRFSFGQELDFKYKIDSLVDGNLKKYTITISVIKGVAPFGYIVYDGMPWKNRIVKTEDALNSQTIKIEGLNGKRVYTVCLFPANNQDAAVVKTVKIH